MKDLLSQTYACGPASSNCPSSQIYGSTQFSFSKDLLQSLYSSPGSGSGGGGSSVLVAACVTDSSTGTRCQQLSLSLLAVNLAIFLSPKV